MFQVKKTKLDIIAASIIAALGMLFPTVLDNLLKELPRGITFANYAVAILAVLYVIIALYKEYKTLNESLQEAQTKNDELQAKNDEFNDEIVKLNRKQKKQLGELKKSNLHIKTLENKININRQKLEPMLNYIQVIVKEEHNDRYLETLNLVAKTLKGDEHNG